MSDKRKLSLPSSIVENITSKLASPRSKALKPPRRLTFTELANVFHRLDTNNDGELSLDEFYNIARKLKLRVDGNEQIKQAFYRTDSGHNTNGSLDINEFRVAYNQLYTELYSSPVGDGGTTFVRATRYGTRSGDGAEPTHFFEVYLGYSEKLTQKLDFPIESIDNRLLSNLQNIKPNSAKIEMTLRQLNEQMLLDNETNTKGTTSILWWVDFCVQKWDPNALNSICSAVGLPESTVSKIIELGPRDKCVGIDRADIESAYARGVAGVCSFYLQSMCLRNVPVISRDPQIVKDYPLGGVLPYLSSRLIPFNPWTYKLAGNCKEYRRMSSIVENDLEVVWDNDYLTVQDQLADQLNESPQNQRVNGSNSNRHRNNYSSVGTLAKSMLDQTETFSDEFAFKNIPLAEVEDEGDDALFLLSSGDLRERPAYLDKESYSLHIQDHGNGPIALYTFRRCKTDVVDSPTKQYMDSEQLSRQSFTFEQLSRSGVLGRMTIGVWRKLLEVSAHKGTATLCGHLTDSSFALGHLLMTMVHASSIEATVSRIDFWKKELTSGVEDIAVTKHGRHIDSMLAILDQIKTYIANFNREIQPLVQIYHERGGSITSNFESLLDSMANSSSHLKRLKQKQKMKMAKAQLGSTEKHLEALNVANTNKKGFTSIELQERFEDIKRNLKLNAKEKDVDFLEKYQLKLSGLHEEYFEQQLVSATDDFHVANMRRDLQKVKLFLTASKLDHFEKKLERLCKSFVMNSQFSSSGEEKDGAGEAEIIEQMRAQRLLSIAGIASESVGVDAVELTLNQSLQSTAATAAVETNDYSHENVQSDSTEELKSRYRSILDHNSNITFDYQVLDDSVKYDLFKEFTTRDFHLVGQVTSAIGLLSYLTQGGPKNDPLNKPCTLNWERAIEDSIEELTSLQERYHRYLDEKRNFWSFLLGIVSIATFPFAVMTGYFGMNFENMAAPGHVLTNDYWPGFPGSDLIWVLTIIIYSVLLAAFLHWQVFYAAS